MYRFGDKFGDALENVRSMADAHIALQSRLITQHNEYKTLLSKYRTLQNEYSDLQDDYLKCASQAIALTKCLTGFQRETAATGFQQSDELKDLVKATEDFGNEAAAMARAAADQEAAPPPELRRSKRKRRD